MDVLFLGICAHLGPIGGSTHRVALPESKNYKAPHSQKDVMIPIPEHRPTLSLRLRDIIEADAVSQWAGSDLTLIDDAVTWELGRVIVSLEDYSAPYDAQLDCLPHIGVPGELEPDIQAGKHPQSVRAYVDLAGGTLQAVIDANGARYAVLHAGIEAPFTLRAGKRQLTLRPDARITVANHEASTCDPCSDDDYLLHYRLTTTKHVDPGQFTNIICIPPRAFDPRGFPLPNPGITSTLLTCSNSTYP